MGIKAFLSRHLSDIPDVRECVHVARTYGGDSCSKASVMFDGDVWMIKFAAGYKDQVKQQNPLFSLHPLTEHIGSRIYDILGIPVQETKLFRYGGHICVGCKDFCENDSELYGYDQIFAAYQKNHPETRTFQIRYLDVVEAILDTWSKDIPDAFVAFWDMYVVDALLNNMDRHAQNWGFLKDGNGEWSFAPIYDNANIFNVTYPEQRIRCRMQDMNRYIATRHCFFYAKNAEGVCCGMNPFVLMQMHIYDNLDYAVMRNVPIMLEKKNEICDCIDSTPFLPKANRQFYTSLIRERIEEYFEPIYEEILNNQEHQATCQM